MNTVLRLRTDRDWKGINAVFRSVGWGSGHGNIVMTHGLRVVAVASVFLCHEPSHKAWISSFAVRESQHGRGFGKMFLFGVAISLMKIGVMTIDLSAETSAVPFYWRCGFDYMGGESNSMTLRLDKYDKRTFVENSYNLLCAQRGLTNRLLDVPLAERLH